MRKGKLIKGLCYTLISSLILGNISPVLAKTSVASVDETIDIKESGSSETSVYAELGSEFLVTIPKSLTLSGIDKKGTYTVSVEGDIAGYEKINIIPDETFTLNSVGLNGITATINQDKTSWLFNEILESNKIIGNGEISANLTAGKWEGSFNFNINLGGLISVDAKDKSGNNLNASASEITGTEKETLLNSLEETGMITSKDEVDALIEVESDEFDGIADTTFNVSSIASEGDKVTILHFDETKQKWEYISTETVDSEGKINANFSSYSPVAFVKITEDGNFENMERPGLYDANGTLLCAWENTDVDIEADYTSSTYYNSTKSPYYIIQKKYPSTTKVVFPNNITRIGNYTFYNLNSLTEIVISDSIIEIGNDAFSGCRKLKALTIPDSVETIGVWAFYDCDGLKTLTIPKNVKNIKDRAFYQCSGLTSITIEGGVTNMDTGVFQNCASLITVTIYDDVPYIGSCTFKECSKLKNITLSEDTISIGDSAFFKCTALTNITIPENTKNLGDSIFEGCSSLSNIIIPKNISSIGRGAFYGCPLTSATFKKTTNWYVGGTKNRIDNLLSSDDLSNTSTAARFLIDEYDLSYWENK